MEINEMELTDIETRASEIEELMKTDDADIETLSKEVEALEERKANILTEVETRKKEVEEVLNNGVEVRTFTNERKTDMEIRNTKEYMDAFANYIKTNDDRECRSLLTENATAGTVPVPELVYDIVKTAWEREGIMSLVRKSYLKGNLKVGFEISGDPAVIHTEGGNAIDPENLVLGVVNLVPKSIKKVIQISDEVYDMRGEQFLRYVYDELTYRIAKKAADELLAKIIACGTVSTSTQVGVPAFTTTNVNIGLVAQALAQLSDEAQNPVVVMNKATWADFKAAQYGGQFNVDPFEGLPVVFNNTLKSWTAASTGDTIAIVGDFGHGALANFPNGDDIEFKFDENTLKKQDLIEILGREYVALEPVAPNAFVKIKK